jgi:DNA recombination protein RmuC
MENVEYIILGLAGLAVILLLVILLRRGRGGDAQKELIELRTLTQRQADELTGMRQQQADQYIKVLKELSDSKQSLTSSLGGQGKDLETFFGKVQSQLTTVTQSAQELNRQAMAIGKLGEIMRSPKLRGYLGELELETVLQNILPAEFFRIQYPIPGVGVVDAVVFLGDKLVPIDSKFPLEAFERLQEAENAEERVRLSARRDFVKAVKARVDEASKYVSPQAGTIDFCLVFLPGEGIYAEASQRRYPDDPSDDILHYAMQRKIALVSPSLLFAYLRTVVLGLQSLHIEKRAEEVMRGLTSLQTLIYGVKKPFEVLGTHLNNAQAQYMNVTREMGKLENRIASLADEALGEEESRPELLPGGESGPPPGGDEKS